MSDPDTRTHYEWAVRIHGTMNGVPGPHILECTDHGLALLRIESWRTRHPEARPEMLRRTVVVTRGAWETP